MYYLGIDLGGTNIVTGLVNENKELLDVISVKTMLPREASKIIQDMITSGMTLVERNNLTMRDIASVGVGAPGTANLSTGYLEYANNLGFDQVPMIQMLESGFGCRVYFDNDANAAAWGEYLLGDYKVDSFVMITLGTGVGGGYIQNGKVFRGMNYAAFEAGHMSIAYDGRQCNCGRKGCFETYASATALIEMTKKAMEDSKDSYLWKLCEDDLTRIERKTVFDGIDHNDKLASKILEEYVSYLSTGVANIINLLQPEVFAIGGGISNAGDYFIDSLRDKVKNQIYSRNSKRNTSIVIAGQNNNAGIIGAALLGTMRE